MNMASAYIGHGNSTSNSTLAVSLGPTSYFSVAEHAGLMYGHISLMVLAWVVVLPVAVMFSIARSRFTIPAQTSFLLVNAFGLLTGVIYRHQTPDLYENNSHNKAGWAVTWIAVAWVAMGLLGRYKKRTKSVPATIRPSQAVDIQALAQYQRVQGLRMPDGGRWSRDSGQGTERDSASLCSDSRSHSLESVPQDLPEIRDRYHSDEGFDDDEDAEKRGFLHNTAVDRLLSRNAPSTAFGRVTTVVHILYSVVERFILILGFLGLASGAAVYGGIFRGNDIFGGLAHFVKGGIFFWYGFVALGRWTGCFSEYGWAWNTKPSINGRISRAPSAEFAESFLIFSYGASNVFLEHLGALGGAWSAQDLEHVSITIMFFGGGLLGMLVESRRVRDLLNTSALAAKDEQVSQDEERREPKTYRISLNPLPGLVILLLGLTMSSHHQHSMVSTMVHKQWGTLFVGAALARAVTYLLMYLSPPTSHMPSRPPSELICAFCLVSGGLIFMGSNKNTVEALEAYGLDAMFIFTVTMGLTALLMAWATVVVAIKGWALRREGKLSIASSTTFA
ncbi:integral membrane protein [Cryomyces antarcticus]